MSNDKPPTYRQRLAMSLLAHEYVVKRTQEALEAIDSDCDEDEVMAEWYADTGLAMCIPTGLLH